MEGFGTQPAQQAYALNSFANTANPGGPAPDGDYSFSGFVYTMETAPNQWVPDPDVSGSGSNLKVTIPNNLNGQPFLFTIGDYGNNLNVLLKAVTITWKSGPWLFQGNNGTSTQPTLVWTNSAGIPGVQMSQGGNSPAGPSVIWAGVLQTSYVNGINRYKGQTMSFTVTVTLLMPNGNTIDFSSDPEMEVDPNG
jgi:hypothetical protein